jgi:6-phosphogluconate dehydrogenase
MSQRRGGWRTRSGFVATSELCSGPLWGNVRGFSIHARFLDWIRQACDAEPKLANVILAEFFATAEETQDAWRRVVARGAELGSRRRSSPRRWPTTTASAVRVPVNLIQGLRDLFGAHTYIRVDSEGSFHTRWGDDQPETTT